MKIGDKSDLALSAADETLEENLRKALECIKRAQMFTNNYGGAHDDCCEAEIRITAALSRLNRQRIAVGEKRELVAIVDKTGERLVRFDVTGYTEDRVASRLKPLVRRLGREYVTMYDTKHGPLPPFTPGDETMDLLRELEMGPSVYEVVADYERLIALSPDLVTVDGFNFTHFPIAPIENPVDAPALLPPHPSRGRRLRA